MRSGRDFDLRQRRSTGDLVQFRRRTTSAPAQHRVVMGKTSADITRLLRAAASGDRSDLDALMAAIYADLHRLAASHMREEATDHTLQPTALVHEAYLRLIGQHATDWKDRVHFFAIASRIIRRILVDHARARDAEKRGGGAARVPLEAADSLARGGEQGVTTGGVDLIELDDALAALALLDERQAKIVEMRFFGGLTIEEIADVLDMGRRSVDRDWRAARAWLYARLNDESEPAEDGREVGPADA